MLGPTWLTGWRLFHQKHRHHLTLRSWCNLTSQRSSWNFSRQAKLELRYQYERINTGSKCKQGRASFPQSAPRRSEMRGPSKSKAQVPHLLMCCPQHSYGAKQRFPPTSIPRALLSHLATASSERCREPHTCGAWYPHMGLTVDGSGVTSCNSQIYIYICIYVCACVC